MKEKDTLHDLATEEPKKYAYIVKAKDKTVRLKIENQDIYQNADGVLDCPIDRVLRKNGYSLYDLIIWATEEIEFVANINGIDETIRTIPFNITL